jgi:dolichol kinase
MTLGALGAGALFYFTVELLRKHGVQVPVIAKVTALVSRPRESGKLVLGPVTLAAGAAASLLVFPPETARIAIYALAFGDGLSGLVGRPFGRLRPPFLFGKSVEGSAVCFLSVAISAYLVSSNLRASLITALVTTVVEALPLRNWDNIAIPLAAGGAALCAVLIVDR